MAKKKYFKGMMNNNNQVDPRRRAEAQDFSMLKEDYSAIANMPQDVKYHAWPKADDYRDYRLDDTIRGIDNQMRQDSKLGKRGNDPEMY